MTVRHRGNQEYQGLAADTKPIPADTAVNATFDELDTGNLFINNGTAWNILRGPPITPGGAGTNIGPERWYIYREGTGATGPYHAFNKRSGNVEYTGTSLDAVLDPVLIDIYDGDQGSVSGFVAQGGHIYIDGTDVYYDCSAGFDGFTIPQYTKIEGPRNARIRVPNGYTGYVFRIPSWHFIDPTNNSSSTQGVWIQGMALHEAGTAVRAWTGILIEAEAETTGSYLGGVGGCMVYGIRMTSPKTGIMLNQLNTTGWINTCWFEKIYISSPKWAGVDQELVANPTSEFNYNVFRDISIQSSGNLPAYGFRNMGHKGTQYINCQVWDILNGQIAGKIDPRTSGGVPCAQDVVISGGLLCNDWDEPPSGTFSAGDALVTAGYYTAGAAYPKKFQDAGENTMIYGDWKLGSQMSKIYIPPVGGIPGTGILSIEGRSTVANTNMEMIGANDSVSTAFSWYNKSKSERFFLNRQSTSTAIEQIRQTAGGTLRPILFRMNDVPGAGSIESFRININGDIQIADTRNIVLNATTGTKIGTATTQKLGFFNKAPVVQPTAIASPTTAVADLKTAIDAIRTALTALGLTA